MIIAGGGAASVYAGEGTATVEFTATGFGTQSSASVPVTVTPVQNGAGSNFGTTSVTSISLAQGVANGAFLAACISLTGSASIVSITDDIEGYDAIVGGFGPVGWWKLNEATGTTAFDSGSGHNNGSIIGPVVLGAPGPIVGTPTDTAYTFENSTTLPSFAGTGFTGTALLGGGTLETDGLVQLAPADDLQFAEGSFSVVGWVNGQTAGSVNGYIFNNLLEGTNATIATGPLGWAIRGMGIMGGGLFESITGGYSLQMNGATNSLSFEVTDTSGNTVTLSTPTSYANAWHFVAAVVDRSVELMSLYVDGSLVGTVSIASVGSILNAPGNNPLIGDGVIGDVAQVFLVDYALTALQISSLYNSSFNIPQSNRWIQAAFSYNTELGLGTEIWYARGCHQGFTVINITSSSTTPYSVNVSEWEGIWYRDPLDQWSQNIGTSSVAETQAVTPRTSSDLFLAVVSAGNDLTSGPAFGYTPLPIGLSGGTMGAGYIVSPFDDPQTTQWDIEVPTQWAVAQASFVPGEAGLNPDLQFPEVLWEISTTTNFMAPLEGIGVWTNFSRYVRNFQIGPLGRQHELDRIQATQSNITVNNRDGSFNVWNTESYLYDGGAGLKPMNPVRCTAAWDGITSNEFYGYLQAVTPQIGDVLNVDSSITCYDILALLNLRYLTNDNYAQLVKADGGANLAAYYRLGDNPNVYSVTDSSGNGNTGSLINGVSGEPIYGATGVFIYDTDGALDLTSGTNLPNGGFSTNDNTTEPPTHHDPLSGASQWSFECWFMWTGSDIPAAAIPANGDNASVAAIPNGTLLRINAPSGVEPFSKYEVQVGVAGTPTLDGLPDYVPNAIVEAFNDGQICNIYKYASNPFDGQWHHLVKPTTPIDVIYLDGKAPITFSSFFATQIVGDVSGLVIGTGPEGVGLDPNGGTTYAQPFSGIVDEVALYTTALTLAQAEGHYATALWFAQQEFGAVQGGAAASRLGKVLAVAGLDPSILLRVPYAWLTKLYDETDTITTTSALNYLQTTSESEPGIIYQGNDGYVYAFNRQYQYLNPTTTTSQATFSDSASSSFFFEGPSLQIAQDDLDLWNDIQVQSGIPATSTTEQVEIGVLQEWGPVQSPAAAYSASVYGPRTLQGLTSLQMANDSDALAIAQNYFAWYGLPIVRVVQMTINSQGNLGANIPQMLQRQLYDAITIEYTGQTPGPTFSQTPLIEQISHSANMDWPQWTTTYATSAYELLMSPFYIGESTIGGPAVLTL